jgi:hypothetical protein
VRDETRENEMRENVMWREMRWENERMRWYWEMMRWDEEREWDCFDYVMRDEKEWDKMWRDVKREERMRFVLVTYLEMREAVRELGENKRCSTKTKKFIVLFFWTCVYVFAKSQSIFFNLLFSL